mgnify:CR=1 FL=1
MPAPEFEENCLEISKQAMPNPEQNKYNGTSVWKKGYFAPEASPEQNKRDPVCGNCHEDHKGKTCCPNLPKGFCKEFPEQNKWEETMKEFWKECHWLICDCDLNARQGRPTECNAEKIDKSIVKLLSQTRQETIEQIKELIVAEINIARTEGDKTSRLTSLFMRITELNAPKT